MLRHLYCFVVRLHPSSFRHRFGGEMLYIFDQQKGTRAALGMTLDCVVSLFKQRTLRSNRSIGLSASAVLSPNTDHIPSFTTLDGFRPSTSAIMNGAALTLILFCMTGFAIRYSWIHVLNLHIREMGTDWQQQIRPQLRSEHSAWLQLDPYVGEYVSATPSRKISVQIESDHLSLAFAGHPSFALSPRSPQRFILDGVATDYVDFSSQTQGQICCLSLIIDGKVIAARRE
jgi:hypothetical protein